MKGKYLSQDEGGCLMIKAAQKFFLGSINNKAHLGDQNRVYNQNRNDNFYVFKNLFSW